MRALLLLGLAAAAYFQSGPLFFVLFLVLMLRLAARLWLRETTSSLAVSRAFEHRVFFGEQATVTLTFTNQGQLPIPWIEATESLPVALRQTERCSRVLALAPGQSCRVSYVLAGRRRGLYGVGPLSLATGDVFGLARRDLDLTQGESLLVYPRIMAAAELELPSLALFGDVRTRRRVLGDPARIGGIRDYQQGDPLHDIHWRATAAAGTLQVKQYEPATTVQTMLYLDLSRDSYPGDNIYEASELAISVAATVAQRLTVLRQEIGLVTTGCLPLGSDPGSSSGAVQLDVPVGTAAGTGLPAMAVPAPLSPARGRRQFMQVLELLARLQVAPGILVPRDLQATGLGLPWGSTLVLITGSPGSDWWPALHRLRQSGLLVVVLVISRQGVTADQAASARGAGVRMHQIWTDAQALVLPA